MSFGDRMRPWEPSGEVLEVLFGHGGVSVGGLRRLGAAVRRPMTNVNPFIVIEGNDATGKASVASFLGESLSAEVISFPVYESPTGQALRAHLRRDWKATVPPRLCDQSVSAGDFLAVTRPNGMPLNALVRQALMTANRCEAHKALLAALARGTVVGDRYTLSSLVYGVAEGMTPEYITNLSAPLLVPNLTVVLDMPPELTSVRRPQARDANELNLPLLRATRKGYRAAAGLWLEEQTAPKLGEPWEARSIDGFGDVTIVDATETLGTVQQHVLAVVRQHLRLE